MDDNEQRRDRIMSEKLMGELEAIKELVSAVPQIKDDVAVLRGDVAQIKAEQLIHTSILKEHSADLRELKQITATQMEAIAELRTVSHSHA